MTRIEPVTDTPPSPTAQAGGHDLILDIRDLRTYFHVMDGTVKAVDGVNFSIPRGKSIGVVGESGCGKSVTALTVMGLLDIPPAEIATGEILFEGRDLLKMAEDERRQLRGSEMAMVFQEPMTSLNPVFRVGDQVSESVLYHMDVSKAEAADRSVAALRRVGISFPERRARQYPHELSGGMRQRVMIAMALACEPKLLIADEPTTALDVTIQAQILELIRATQEETGAALMLITHDLGVVAEMVDEVIVMYAGRVVEHGTAEEVLLDPKHPYSEGLLDSIPSRKSRGKRLNVIKGTVPNPFNMPQGCNFGPRCPDIFGSCEANDPRLKALGDRQVACWKHHEVPS